MKKFLSIILSVIMTLTICSVFTSCASLNMKNSEVVLLGMTASTDYVEYKAQNEVQPKLASPYAMAADIKLMDDTEQEVTPDLTNAYTIVYKPLDGGQISIYYTIVLDNPKDHYIMDFKFSCDKDVQIQYVDGNTASIKSRRVRWDEAYSRQGNYIATFILIIPNEVTNPTTIRVSEMYYSDHADGGSKTIVNTNDKEVYKVYTLDGIYVNQTRYTVSSADFKITKNEGLTVKSVSFNDKELEFNNAKKVNKYTVNESGKLVIKYSYSQNIGNIPGINKDEVVLEKNIEIFSKDWFQPYEGRYINVDSIEYTTEEGEKQVEYYTFIYCKFSINPIAHPFNDIYYSSYSQLSPSGGNNRFLNKYHNQNLYFNFIDYDIYNEKKSEDHFQQTIRFDEMEIVLDSIYGVISQRDVDYTKEK